MTAPNDLRWKPDLTSRKVDSVRIKDIAFTPMPLRLRNELISSAYGDLAQAMAELLGPTDATWAAFGQWASHTIGGYLTIPVPVLGTLIGKAFGDGNRDVFADIGRAHAVFLATVGAAARRGGDTADAWARCEHELRKRLFKPPGDPGGGTEDEFWVSVKDPRLQPGGPHHNQLLVLGFRAYYHALGASDAEQRSQHVLLGNCLLALHEQKLLSLAISIGFRSWLRTLTTPWATLQTRYAWRHQDPGSLRLRLEHAWIRFATWRLVGVALPTGLVKVGGPVPDGDRPIVVRRVAVHDGTGRRRIEDLSDETMLGKVFTLFEVDGRRSRCWNDLGDRMGYIMGLFAQHQRATWWFDGHGLIVRPDPWPELDAALAEQLALMARPEAISRLPGETVPSPLTDEQLDRMRSRPTHLALDDPDDLSLETVADESHAERAHLLRRDVADRRDRITQPGELLDPATCRTAREVFSQWSTVWFMGLVFRSLPDSYAAAAGVHVLGRVSDLATDPFRRAGETAFFIIDLLGSDDGWDNGLMEADGAAFRSVQGVRVMHALAAHRLLVDGWKSRSLGVPFNEEDVVGGALTFGVASLEMLEGLGVRLPKATRDAVVRFWLGIGHLLGAPYEAVTAPSLSGRAPLDYHQARALALAIRRRSYARSLDGVRLTEALMEGVADGFPRWFGWMAPGLMQALGDERVSRLLLVGTGRGRQPAAVVTAVFRFLLRIRPLRPVTRAVIQAVGRRWVQPFLDQGRTRPYRRPLRADDLARLEAEARKPDWWPANCVSGRAPSGVPGRGGPESRRRRRRRAA